MTDIRPRALVIDDETYVRGVLCELLEMWGVATDPAESGTVGLALFEGGQYDLVLTDFSMPGINGLDVVEDVRRRGPEVPVVMLTAAVADLSAEAQRLGFTLLRKPVQIAELQRAVRGVLSGAPVAQEGR